LWAVLGALALAIVGVAVVAMAGGTSPVASSSPTPTDGDDKALPTPIPVQTVEPGPSPSEPVPVPPVDDDLISGAVEATDGSLTVRLVSLRPITITAWAPREVGGPGLAVTIVVTNGSSEEVDLAMDVAVHTTTRTGVSADLDGHNSPFETETLAPGQSAERTIAFACPNAAGTPVAVMVFWGPSVFSLQATVR